MIHAFHGIYLATLEQFDGDIRRSLHVVFVGILSVAYRMVVKCQRRLDLRLSSSSKDLLSSSGFCITCVAPLLSVYRRVDK